MDTAPPGSAIVTPNDMLSEIRALRRAVDVLTTKVDPALADVRHDVDDHETRIRAVERRVWIAAGTALAGGAGLSQAISALLGG